MRHTTDARAERANILRLVHRHELAYLIAATRYVSYKPSSWLDQYSERMLTRADALDEMADLIRFQLAPLTREPICDYCTQTGEVAQ